jgi:hypothetical protein
MNSPAKLFADFQHMATRLGVPPGVDRQEVFKTPVGVLTGNAMTNGRRSR